MRASRKLNDGFKKTKTLGVADDPEDDNIASWVTKSRTLEEKRKEEERLKAERMARALEAQDDDAENDSDDGGGDIYSSRCAPSPQGNGPPRTARPWLVGQGSGPGRRPLRRPPSRAARG